MTSTRGDRLTSSWLPDIDITTVATVRDFLLTLEGDVEVNCTGVTFIDSARVGMFIALHKVMRERGHRLTLRELKPTCYRVFEITRLTEFLDVEGSSAAI